MKLVQHLIILWLCVFLSFSLKGWAQTQPGPTSETQSETKSEVKSETEPETREEEVERIAQEVIEKSKKEALKPKLEVSKTKKKIAKERKSTTQKEREPIVWTSPYATTEEVLLPAEIGALRRTYVPTDPFYHGGRETEEQALFEDVARRDQEGLYYAIEEVERKPLWRSLLESLSAVVQYKQGLYSNYFNNRATHRLITWNPLTGIRMKRWGVLSFDLNYYGNFERLSFEPITIDPHMIKTHGGQGKLLYKPSKRFHFLASNEVRKSNKISGVEGNASNISLGNNTVGNTLVTEFRYFITPKDIVDLSWEYDYSRTASQDALRISRGYVPKISVLKMFGSRVIGRLFYSFDYLKTSDPAALATDTTSASDTAKFTSFRHEPGFGGTIILGKRLVFDGDFAKQRLRFRGSDTSSKGNRISLKLTHQLTKRATHSYLLTSSDVEGKRSSISDVDNRDNAAFESFSISGQFGYQVTSLTRFGTTWEYIHTDPNTPDAETNNRKRITVELSRPLFRNRADLAVSWIFDKNTGAISGSYFAHTIFVTLKMNYGAGRAK